MKVKENKGVTIIALVLTIAVIFILSGVVITNMNTGNEFEDYQRMKADIELISNNILIYYHKYGVLPTKDNVTSVNLNGQASSNDNSNYYEIDLAKTGDMTLNYGGKSDSQDIYIVNEQSHEVYYLKGIKYEGELKHK